jgi:hypothetical protein
VPAAERKPGGACFLGRSGGSSVSRARFDSTPLEPIAAAKQMDELSLGNALALLPWHPGGRPVSRAERLTWIGRCESGLDGGHARGVTTRSESAGSLTLASASSPGEPGCGGR